MQLITSNRTAPRYWCEDDKFLRMETPDTLCHNGQQHHCCKQSPCFKFSETFEESWFLTVMWYDLHVNLPSSDIAASLHTVTEPCQPALTSIPLWHKKIMFRSPLKFKGRWTMMLHFYYIFIPGGGGGGGGAQQELKDNG